MTKLSIFDPPANLRDFTSGSTKDQALRKLWSRMVNTWTNDAIRADKNKTNYYYNPLETDIPDNAATSQISWISFPNRINIIYAGASQKERWHHADAGPPADDYYQPQGPRGWQDEYCEWIVTRNADCKITKVTFTCENPEYWQALWVVDQQKVLDLYQTLISKDVKLADLTDSETGGYKPINKWNNSTSGPMHLISTPNTLPAEIRLGVDATILRKDANGNPVTAADALISCGQFGQPNRNSDPHIGQSINDLVLTAPHLRISLKNPVGLYMQTPSFSPFELPSNAPSDAKPSDYWKVIRGQGDQILRATYEVPEELGFTVGDISINNDPIKYGSQICDHLCIQLVGQGLPDAPAAPVAHLCEGEQSSVMLPSNIYLIEGR